MVARCPLAEEDEARQILQGIAFGPPEIGVRRLLNAIADGEQDGRDRVGNSRPLRPQDAEPADLLAATRTGAANSEGSRTVTSRKMTGSPWGYGWPPVRFAL